LLLCRRLRNFPEPAGKLFPLFLLVVVDDFELRVYNVAFALARVLFGTRMPAGLGPSLWAWLWTGLR
jgi:hypothetical protein